MDERRAHWEKVYEEKAPDSVSWFQERPASSLALIERAGGGRVIDVGGGASTLVDHLVADHQVTVLDISEAALGRARARLGDRASEVRWVRADATDPPLEGPFDVWHDRAVFHFLTDPPDRARYREALHRLLAPEGEAVVATFALDGPERCSGLPVQRWSAEGLAAELGLVPVETLEEAHETPAGKTQRFVFCRMRRG